MSISNFDTNLDYKSTNSVNSLLSLTTNQVEQNDMKFYQDNMLYIKQINKDPEVSHNNSTFQQSEDNYIENEIKAQMIQTTSFQNNDIIDNDFFSSDIGSDNSNLQIDGNTSLDKAKSINGKRVYIKRNPEKVRRWTREEALLYEKFIEMYADIMRDSSSKRNTKIFLLMSQFIGTKTPSQCRSHHQKFYKKLIKARQLMQNPNQQISDEQKNQNQKTPIINYKKKNQKPKKKADEKMNDKFDSLNDPNDYQMIQGIQNQDNQYIEDDFFNQALYFKKIINNFFPQDNSNLFSINNIYNSSNKDEFQNTNIMETPKLAGQRKSSLDIDQSFSLNPVNIQTNYDDDYTKLMTNSEDKVNWRKVFNHVDQVEKSIINLLNMIDNQVSS